MSAREELAEIIQDCGEYIPGSHADDYVSPEKAADAILAAGYRKPRTVTTIEELDALPVGSAVLRHGRVWTRHVPRTYHGGTLEDHKWMCADGGFIRADSQPVLLLPATVIWEPLSLLDFTLERRTP